MGPHKRPWKNDTIDATKNASSHHSNEKKRQKKKTQSKEEETVIEKVEIPENTTDGDEETENLVNCETETVTDIEEEDWIEYKKRSTEEAIDQMKKQRESNAGSKHTEEWIGD